MLQAKQEGRGTAALQHLEEGEGEEGEEREEGEVPLQGTPGNQWFYVTAQSMLWPPESSVTVGK